MSAHDELSGTTVGGKVGCLVGSLVGTPVIVIAFFFEFFGECYHSDACHHAEGLRLVAVILVTLGVAFPVGLLIRKLVNRRLARKG